MLHNVIGSLKFSSHIFKSYFIVSKPFETSGTGALPHAEHYLFQMLVKLRILAFISC